MTLLSSLPLILPPGWRNGGQFVPPRALKNEAVIFILDYQHPTFYEAEKFISVLIGHCYVGSLLLSAKLIANQ